MADEKHLEILKERKVKGWNQWREDNPDIRPDLSSAELEGAYLYGANLRSANLRSANLRSANLRSANLRSANLRHANLVDANLRKANLYGANLYGANLRSAYLESANLSSAELESTNLYGAYLYGANLRKANLYGANLVGANLRSANLESANLESANLYGAYLIGANLRSANLESVNLESANLESVKLHRVQALGTHFEGATLTGACIEDWNINSKTNLQNVKCDYIYLKANYSKEELKWIYGDRRPHDPDKNFAPGEFTKLYQKALETVDLLFEKGVDWQAAAYSLKNTQVLNEEIPLTIQSIENKGDGAVLIRVNVPEEVNKGKIEGDFWQGYEFAQKTLEGQHQDRLQDKEQEINRLMYIVDQQREQIGEGQKLLAEVNKTINVRQNYNENIQGNNYEQKGNFGVGNNQGEISGDAEVTGQS